MLYPYEYGGTTWSSGPDPVTGPGDVGRDRKGLRDADRTSLDPSTNADMAGDRGLLEAEDCVLPEPASSAFPAAPSVCAFFVAGVVAFGEPLDGVPNWKTINIRLRPFQWFEEHLRSKISGSARCTLLTADLASRKSMHQAGYQGQVQQKQSCQNSLWSSCWSQRG
jgi:hypothetical protein